MKSEKEALKFFEINDLITRICSKLLHRDLIEYKNDLINYVWLRYLENNNSGNFKWYALDWFRDNGFSPKSTKSSTIIRNSVSYDFKNEKDEIKNDYLNKNNYNVSPENEMIIKENGMADKVEFEKWIEDKISWKAITIQTLRLNQKTRHFLLEKMI
jgi:hypothetical protein